MWVGCTCLKYHIEYNSNNNKHHQFTETTGVVIPKNTITSWMLLLRENIY